MNGTEIQHTLQAREKIPFEETHMLNDKNRPNGLNTVMKYRKHLFNLERQSNSSFHQQQILLPEAFQMLYDRRLSIAMLDRTFTTKRLLYPSVLDSMH